MDYDLIVIGCSWGGLHALSRILDDVGSDLPATIVAQHRDADGGEGLSELLRWHTELEVRDAEDKDELRPRTVYLAPPGYHLLVEHGGTLALSTEDVVSFARPSIDVLFESAAQAYRERCVGVVLTGANADGAVGLARIQSLGGVVVVQDPATAERGEMPEAAIEATHADVVLPLEEIGKFLKGLVLPAPVRSATT